MKHRNVEEYVLKEILKDCNLYERLFVKVNLRICVKVLSKGSFDAHRLPTKNKICKNIIRYNKTL